MFVMLNVISCINKKSYSGIVIFLLPLSHNLRKFSIFKVQNIITPTSFPKKIDYHKCHMFVYVDNIFNYMRKIYVIYFYCDTKLS
jgi:hypothetical protein